jgi:FAD/FMN-containing dehydrogenase
VSRRVFTSWGGLRAEAIAVAPETWRAGRGGLMALPYGAGRSYGDSGLNAGGAMIEARPGARIHDFDAASGEIALDAGVPLRDLVAHVMPQGWFPPVLPGTGFVTVGGAIANDVHGKNHHADGTFGRHVLDLRLERSDGFEDVCGPDRNADLFAATIGGMGLTGLIRSARLKLMPVKGPFIVEEAEPFDDLAGFFRLAGGAPGRRRHAVAWIDQMARGAALGRGVFLSGEHADRPGPWTGRGVRPAVPFTPPLPLIGPLSMRLFNAAYRTAQARKAGAPRETRWEAFFHPLDAVLHWNRLYGPRGLRQFQCVLPPARAEAGVAALLEETHRHRAASFLTVLKLFGDSPSPGLLSFPMAGATLTLDFAHRGRATDRLLAALDAIVLAAGGRVCPYKDARMPRATFEASFPAWRRLEAMRDPALMSDFWRRVTA